MNCKKSLLTAALALALPLSVMASGGASGTKIDWIVEGELGTVVINPYDIAPLTAVIRNGGYVLTKASVRIVPKKGGQEIRYDVGPQTLLTHGGIPVWGLYADYMNTVEVRYTRVFQGKSEEKTETYKIRTAPVYFEATGNRAQSPGAFQIDVKTRPSKEFKDRLYFINNLLSPGPKSQQVVWNNPVGGAQEWANYPQNAVVDTTGETRWFMKPDAIYDPRDPFKSGIMMGFHQNDDGTLTWGYGQRYVKYDIMGREVYNRLISPNYNDFSHALSVGENGHQFLRVGSSDLRRADNTHVRTVRDVIIEVDSESGNVVDEWRLFEILDPQRNIVLKSIDQGAVCLNVDLSKSGQTLTAEQIAKLEAQHAFGDITGTGAGRNWAHVNSVDYDAEDDSIIISSRHQSSVVKIGRDKKVKWILSAPNGWRGEWKDKVLTPVDKDGNPLKCRLGKCEGDFDWTWTQHTGWKINEMSKGDIIYVSVFDNGDGRAFVQPDDPKEKYSRAVVYKIDQKKMTVEQIWEYGKNRGHELYAPITSSVEYQKDKDSVVVYWASIGVGTKEGPAPVLTEFKWGASKPSIEMKFHNTLGYRALPLDVQKAFAK